MSAALTEIVMHHELTAVDNVLQAERGSRHAVKQSCIMLSRRSDWLNMQHNLC